MLWNSSLVNFFFIEIICTLSLASLFQIEIIMPYGLMANVMPHWWECNVSTKLGVIVHCASYQVIEVVEQSRDHVQADLKKYLQCLIADLISLRITREWRY